MSHDALTDERQQLIEKSLNRIRARNLGEWSLVDSLAHGYNQGAVRVRASDGRDGVLKVGRGAWLHSLRRAAPILRRARSRGWPAPAFLAFGQVDEDAYLLREWIDGKTVLEGGCSAEVLESILTAVEIQSGIASRGSQDWSAYTREVLFSEAWSGREPLLERSAATAHLVSEAGRLTEHLRQHQLPTTDLVHGDFNFANILVRTAGGVAFVDMEQAGRGTRVYDLAVLLMVAGWDDRSLSVDLRLRLREHANAVAGPEVLLICSAAISLDWARFGLTHWPAADLDRFASRRVEELGQLAMPIQVHRA